MTNDYIRKGRTYLYITVVLIYVDVSHYTNEQEEAITILREINRHIEIKTFVNTLKSKLN